MKGKVLDYNFQAGEGIISGNDGERYTFVNSEWRSSDIHPSREIEVDFTTENGSALGIYAEEIAVSSQYSSKKSKVVAGILALFLGGFGVHKFYLGCTNAGIIMLIIWVLGWVLIGIPSIIIAIIAFIEALTYFFKSDAEFNRIYVENKKCWF